MKIKFIAITPLGKFISDDFVEMNTTEEKLIKICEDLNQLYFKTNGTTHFFGKELLKNSIVTFEIKEE